MAGTLKRIDPWLPVLFLLSVLTACGAADDRTAVRILRLVDLADRATFKSQIDLSGDRPGAWISGEVIFAERFDGRAEQSWAVLSGALRVEQPRIEGTGAGRRLVLAPGDALLCCAEVQSDQTYELLVAVTGADLDGLAVVALELDRPLTSAELDQSATVAEAFSGSGSRKHTLNPVKPGVSESAGRALYSGSFRTSEGGTRALLIMAGSARSRLLVDELLVTRPSPFREQLLLRAAEFDHPYVRRVAVGRDFREALVLVAPGEARFKLRLPAGRPRFRMSVGAPDHGRISGSRVVVTVRGRELHRTAEIELLAAAHPAWTPLELDLSDFAGQEVELLLTARPNDPDRPGDGLAFGRPVIEVLEELERRPPDVILISLDTMRADRMSLYGAKRPTTPFLDRFADEALVFDVAIAPAAYTLPSHASMLTGQLPDRIAGAGPVKGVHPLAAPLLARDFRAAGYRTCAFTGGGYMHPAFGFDGGFERFATLDLGMALRLGERADQQSRGALEDLAGLLTADAPEPRFLFLHTFAAHQYRSPASDLAAVGATPEEIPLLLRLHEQQRPVMDLLAELGGSGPDNQRRLALLYDGAQRVADNFVKHVVGLLRASGRLDRTLIVIVSDHGEELYEHGGFGHAHQIYEELIHVPFLVRGPGILPGRNREVVSLVDLAPTLRELCGLPEPGAAMDGRSLVPLLSGQTLSTRAAIARVARPGDPLLRAYRGRRHKLLLTAPAGVELFDLELDPGERRRITDPELSARLRALLEARVDKIAGQGAGFDPDLSPAVLDELEQLGYIGRQRDALRDRR